MLRDVMDLEVEVEPDPSVVIDRSLDSSRLRTAIGWAPPPWERMLRDLAADPTPYETIRDEPARR